MPNDLVVVLVVSQSPTSAKVLRSTRIVTIQVTWSGAVSRVAGDRVTERVHDVVAVFAHGGDVAADTEHHHRLGSAKKACDLQRRAMGDAEACAALFR
jgi:hypothetical protein